MAHASERQIPEWLQVIGDRNMNDMLRGLSRLEATPPKFLPGAGEFNAMCREYQPGTFAGSAAPESDVVPMIGRDRDSLKAEGVEAMRRIRARLTYHCPAVHMRNAIEARMDLLHETRAEAIGFLREHLPPWYAQLEAPDKVACLAVLNEATTEVAE